LKINPSGIDIIATFEGWSSEVYLDPIGIPTIGYGSTWDAGGDRVTEAHPPISRKQGEDLLLQEIEHVEGAIGYLTAVPLTSNQFSALCSLVYNIGSGNYQSSTLRMKLNRGDYSGAGDEFWKWRRAGGRILKGLVRRRAVEADLFRTHIS
tara:strand:- start:19731 stop:20183 length:453 start_codon:yes stop_codon:yes gene_type:complete